MHRLETSTAKASDMLSFQIVESSSSQLIQIDCDDAGLATLIEALKRVPKNGHVHLCSPSCGGKELSDATPFGKPAVGEVIITIGGD
jgi:hypothetical protein